MWSWNCLQQIGWSDMFCPLRCLRWATIWKENHTFSPCLEMYLEKKPYTNKARLNEDSKSTLSRLQFDSMQRVDGTLCLLSPVDSVPPQRLCLPGLNQLKKQTHPKLDKLSAGDYVRCLDSRGSLLKGSWSTDTSPTCFFPWFRGGEATSAVG